ncbi:hypothetical protein RI054_01g03260 [Pseudoscourfieldia marina]
MPVVFLLLIFLLLCPLTPLTRFAAAFGDGDDATTTTEEQAADRGVTSTSRWLRRPAAGRTFITSSVSQATHTARKGALAASVKGGLTKGAWFGGPAVCTQARRIGAVALCGDRDAVSTFEEPTQRKQPCLIVTVLGARAAREFSFEAAAAERSCTVKAFALVDEDDGGETEEGQEGKERRTASPPRGSSRYVQIRLASNVGDLVAEATRSLHGAEHVDVLRLDCDGCEWQLLNRLHDEAPGTLARVVQVVVRVRTDMQEKDGDATAVAHLMEQHAFKPWYISPRVGPVAWLPGSNVTSGSVLLSLVRFERPIVAMPTNRRRQQALQVLFEEHGAQAIEEDEADDDQDKGTKGKAKKAKKGKGKTPVFPPPPPPAPPFPSPPPHALLTAKTPRRFDPAAASSAMTGKKKPRYKRVGRRRAIRPGEFEDLSKYNRRRYKTVRRAPAPHEGEALVVGTAFSRAYKDGILAPSDLVPTRIDAQHLPDARRTKFGGERALVMVGGANGTRVAADSPSWCRQRLDVACNDAKDDDLKSAWLVPWNKSEHDALPLERALLICGADAETRNRLRKSSPMRRRDGESCASFVDRIAAEAD